MSIFSFNLSQKFRISKSLRVFTVLFRLPQIFPSLYNVSVVVKGAESGVSSITRAVLWVECHLSWYPLRQVHMAVASLAALTLGMCLFMCFPLSVQSVFELPSFFGSSFCSACNLGTHQAAFFQSEHSPCWVVIIFVIFPCPRWRWLCLLLCCLQVWMQHRGLGEGAGLASTALGQAPPLPSWTPSHSLRSSHLKDRHNKPL